METKITPRLRLLSNRDYLTVPARSPISRILVTVQESPREGKKRVDTNGYACPQPASDYVGITDADSHALVGYDWIDQAQTIRKLRCQACHKTFSVRKGTPRYLKTDPKRLRWCSGFWPKDLIRR